MYAYFIDIFQNISVPLPHTANQHKFRGNTFYSFQLNAKHKIAAQTYKRGIYRLQKKFGLVELAKIINCIRVVIAVGAENVNMSAILCFRNCHLDGAEKSV